MVVVVVVTSIEMLYSVVIISFVVGHAIGSVVGCRLCMPQDAVMSSSLAEKD